MKCFNPPQRAMNSYERAPAILKLGEIIFAYVSFSPVTW